MSKSQLIRLPKIMDLNLNNLDEIHRMLVKTHQGAINGLALINIDSTIEPSPEKRQLLNKLMDSMGGYLFEISHLGVVWKN